MPVSTPSGGLVAYFGSPGYIICRTEDGDAWECNPYVPGDSGFPRAFAAARPGGPVPEARLIANGQGGPAYSDDDGRTWHPSNLMISVQTFGWGLAVIDGGPLHGTAVAVAQPGSNGYRVFQTTDGATWTDVGPAPDTQVPGWDGVDLVAIPGGLVAAYGNGAEAWLSGDGGRTWRSVFDSDGPGADDSQEQVTDLDVGPDGRLYLGVLSSRTQDAAERGGVYRTTGPLFAVAGEAPPAGAQGLGVSVRPNPSGRRTEIVLTLAEAQPVRVSVFDALGREVAVMLDGAVGVGERVVGVDTSAWPAGVYVVRASVGGRTVSARLVVAR